MDRQGIEDFFVQHENDMLADISRLVRIASDRQPAGPGEPFGAGPAAALAEALEIARDYGFSIKNYDNYVGTIDLGDGPACLDILAHLDVVPAGSGWQVTEPFEPRIVDGRIYGRGTADDKGPAVAALYAMRAVAESGIQLKGRVRLILGTDEECGSSDIDHYYQYEAEAPMTFSPDAEFPVINIEKGRLQGELTASWPVDTDKPHIVSIKGGVKFNVVPDAAEAVLAGFTAGEISKLAESASVRTGLQFSVEVQGDQILIKARGKGAHAATPEMGNNAITGLLNLLASLPLTEQEGFRVIQALSSLLPHGDWHGRALGVAMADDLSGPLTLSFNIIEVDEAGLKGAFDCRAPLCAHDGNVRAVAAARFKEHHIVLADHPMVQPHHVPEDLPFIQTLLRRYEEFSGKKGQCLAIGGGTYVHSLQRGVAFGCADKAVDNHLHGADEFADISQLVMSAKIFTRVIIDLCS